MWFYIGYFAFWIVALFIVIFLKNLQRRLNKVWSWWLGFIVTCYFGCFQLMIAKNKKLLFINYNITEYAKTIGLPALVFLVIYVCIFAKAEIIKPPGYFMKTKKQKKLFGGNKK